MTPNEPAVRFVRRLKNRCSDCESQLLHARAQFGLRNLWVVQYRQRAEHLRAYVKASGQAPLPAWQAFNARIGAGGDVGIWHETYVTPAGHAESVYVNMPRFGLGRAGQLFPATGRRASATKRLTALWPPSEKQSPHSV